MIIFVSFLCSAIPCIVGGNKSLGKIWISVESNDGRAARLGCSEDFTIARENFLAIGTRSLFTATNVRLSVNPGIFWSKIGAREYAALADH